MAHGFQINERELRKLVQGIARQLEDADSTFREAQTGLPVHVVRADVADALPNSITLSAKDLDKYAATVTGDEPFEFHLGE